MFCFNEMMAASDRFAGHINTADEMNVASLEFESQKEAEAWCAGFINGMKFADVAASETFWWSVWSESKEVSSWSDSEGYLSY